MYGNPELPWARRRAGYPDFSRWHGRYWSAAAGRRRAGLAAYAGAHRAPVCAKEIAEYANKGNKDAMEVYQQCGKMLGQGLAVLIDLLNPERIILGSVYVRSKELLLDTMWEVLQRECLPKSLECCQILPSGLGEKLGDVAALTVAAYGMDREKKQGINL